MHFLFFCPRFHTNMVPLIEGLLKRNNEVMVCVSREGEIEDHTFLSPVSLQESCISLFTRKTLGIFLKKDPELLFNACFLPKRKEISRIINVFKPDIIVVRNYSFFSMRICCVAKQESIRSVVVYDQKFLKDCLLEGRSPKAILRRFFFPNLRYTPVDDPSSNIRDYLSPHCHSFFVPFVVSSFPYQPEKQKKRISILTVGKYRDYKNLFFLVDSLLFVSSSKEFSLTVVGQCDSDEERRYYQSLLDYVTEKRIGDRVCLLKGVSYQSMPSYYTSSDFFVLCSKHDQANISVLESMSFGRPVISTDANGTACYVTRSNGGFVYPAGNIQSLAKDITSLINDDEMRVRLGLNGYNYIHNVCTVENYEKDVFDMVNSTAF